MPSPQCRIIMSHPIIMPVQTFLCIKFLTVILVRLHTARTCEHTAEWIIMRRFLYISIFIYNYPVVSLMIFQIVMILLVRQRNIPLFSQQQLLNTVFIDHIIAIVRLGGANIFYVVECTEFPAVGCIDIGKSTIIPEYYTTRQI